MKTFSFDVTASHLVYLLTITRLDQTVQRVCTWPVAITIGGVTWSPVAGLKVGDITTANDGTPASASFSVASESGGTFDPTDIGNGKYNDAQVQIDITDGMNPVSKDFMFIGQIGNIDFTTTDQASFDLRSPYGYPRNIFVRIFAAMCQTDHGSRLCKIPILRDDVERSTAYALGDTARVNFDGSTTPDGYRNVYLECTTAGTTAGAAPTFDDTVGGTTTDGTVVWTTRNAFERYAQVDTITATNKFTIKNLTEPRATALSWFTPGRVLFQNGYSNQRSEQIAGWDPDTNEVTLFMPITDLIDTDDWLNIWPGCDKTISMCTAKYANAKNFRGFPYSAGARFTSAPAGGIYSRLPSAQPGDTGDTASGGGDGIGGGNSLIDTYGIVTAVFGIFLKPSGDAVSAGSSSNASTAQERTSTVYGTLSGVTNNVPADQSISAPPAGYNVVLGDVSFSGLTIIAEVNARNASSPFNTILLATVVFDYSDVVFVPSLLSGDGITYIPDGTAFVPVSDRAGALTLEPVQA